MLLVLRELLAVEEGGGGEHREGGEGEGGHAVGGAGEEEDEVLDGVVDVLVNAVPE